MTDNVVIVAPPAPVQVIVGAPPTTTLVFGTDQAFTDAQIRSVVGSADAAHDTLGEIQALLNANDGAIAGLMTAIGARLAASANLADLTDKAASRSNLGLGSAATKNIGTAVGTVAAGDDSRIVGAASVEQAFVFSLVFG